LTVLRDGNPQELTATLEEFETKDTAGDQENGDSNGPQKQSENGKLGLSLQPVTPQVAKQLGLEGNPQGLVVTDLDPAGPAAEAGIARGDVILEINRQAVSSTDQVQAALEKGGSRPVLLLVSRKGQTIFLTVRP
jgi:serine protease Do